jgi:iron complex outermembrane receptor protein
MKKNIFSLFWLMLFLCPFVSLKAQQRTNVASTTKPLADVLQIVSDIYHINFLYEENSVSGKFVQFNKETIRSQKIGETLEQIFALQRLTFYAIDRSNYSIFPIKDPETTKSTTTPNLILATDTTKQGRISGKVLNESGLPQPFATTTLIRASDSLVISNVLTDTAGIFNFNGIKHNLYRLRVTTMGYKEAYSQIFVLKDAQINLPVITMEIFEYSLKTVQIRASRPQVETRSDRFILNVENSAMASGNSIQLLKSAPFVQVSADNTVSLQGKKTMILIDNKPIPDASLESILKSLPAGNISKVELITHPSAKYDASYGAVINITTKKSKIEGLTGNINIQGSQGIYSNGNVNGSLTYKHRSLTLFGSVDLTQEETMSQNVSERVLGVQTSTEVLTNNSTLLSHDKMLTIQLGAEVNLGKNQTIGAFINPSFFSFNGPWNSLDAFRKLNSPIDSILYTNATYKQKPKLGNYNINYHLLTDSGKNDLTVLFTYTSFMRTLEQSFPTLLTDAAGVVIRNPPFYQTANGTNIHVYNAQADYIHLFGKQWKLESGIKYQATVSKTTTDFELESGSGLQQVPQYTSNGTFNEEIASGYGIITKNWKENDLQVGIRAENTNAIFVGYFNQRYFGIFPTAFFQHNFNAANNLSISFKRTINRAPYYDQVPYSVFVNQYTIEQGNPALKPEYDNIYSLNTNIHKLNLSLSYTNASGLISLLPASQNYLTGATIFSWENIDHSSDLSLYAFYPLTLTSWWVANSSGNVLGYDKAQGKVLGDNYKVSGLHSDLKIANIISFAKIFKLQLDAYYWTKYTVDLSRYSAYRNVDAALLITVLKGRGQVRIGGYEILFARNTYSIVHDFNTYSSKEYWTHDSRRVTAGFTYNFGKNKIKSPDKKLGNDDVIKRLK